MTIKQILHRLNRKDLSLFPKIPKFLKISLIIILAFSTIIVTKNILAQEQAPTNPIKAKQDAMLKGNNQESWLDSAMTSNLMSIQTMMSGTFPDEILNQEIDPSGGRTSYFYIPQGLIGLTSQAAASLYSPPASGVEYIAQVKNNFLGKPAYAAETGFQGLTAIMDLWKAFRNVSYVLIALIFVILGIMIMLRIKISPQAVITIQTSIPKIVTTLILITFSYAIAGLVIDFMNLFLAISLSLLFKGLGVDLSENLFHVSGGDWSITNLITLVRSWFGDNAYNFKALSTANLYEMFLLIKRLVPNTFIVSLATLAVGIFMAPAGPIAILFGLGAGLLVNVILSVVIFIIIFKLTFGLTKCYIKAMIQIVFAPFILLVGAMPNAKNKFGTWLTTVVANLSVFPITILFLVLANLFIDRLAKFQLWAPTLVSGPVDWMLPIIVGITATAMLSKLPQIIPEAIFQIKPASYEKAIGESFAALPGAGLARTFKSGAQLKMGNEMADKAGHIVRGSKPYNATAGIFGQNRGKVNTETGDWLPNEGDKESKLNKYNIIGNMRSMRKKGQLKRKVDSGSPL